MCRTIGNVTAPMGSRRRFSYDTLDRLTHAVYLGDPCDEEFTYDDLGNRLTLKNRDGDEVMYAHNNINEYTTIGVNSLTHDTAGNMTECNLDYTYEYDYENRLTSIEDYQQNLVAEYTYDALGRRIEKIADGVTTRYYYDGWRVLTEVEGSTSRDFVYGNYLDEALIMVDPSGDDHYYDHNHLFSPVALIADDGTVEERYEYDAYGKMTRLDPDFTAWSGTPAGNPYYFTGQRLDELDGGNLLIMYYKNRYYLPDIGRFIQTDPLGVNDGICIIEFTDEGEPHFPRKNNITDQYHDAMSLYEYVKSNPIQHQDSLGMSAIRFPGIFEDCGYVVYCREIKAETWDEKIAKWLGLYHCDLQKRKFGFDPDRKGEVNSPVFVDRSEGRMLMAGTHSGTPCRCATCSQIDDCVNSAQKLRCYPRLGNNCHTATGRALSQCCFKTKWKPAWHAGDPTCIRWETIVVHGGAIDYCAERTPSFDL